MIIDLQPIVNLIFVLAVSVLLPAPVSWWLTGLAGEARRHPEYNGRLSRLFRSPKFSGYLLLVSVTVTACIQIILWSFIHGAERAALAGMVYIGFALVGIVLMAITQALRAAARWFQRVAVVGKPVEREIEK